MDDGNEPDLATARLINSGAIHILRALRRMDREAGLTSARLSALSVLVFGGPCTLGQLAAAEDVAGPTMTRIVDGLAELDLAGRAVEPGRGRSVTISATPAGYKLMQGAAGRRLNAIAEQIEQLDPDERRCLQMAAPILGKIAAGLRTD